MVKKEIVSHNVDGNSSIKIEVPTTAKEIHVKKISVASDNEVSFDVRVGQQYNYQNAVCVFEDEEFRCLTEDNKIMMEIFNNSSASTKFKIELDYNKLL